MSPSLANFYANQAAFAKGQARWDNAAEPEPVEDALLDGINEARMSLDASEAAFKRGDFKAALKAMKEARECLEEPK